MLSIDVDIRVIQGLYGLIPSNDMLTLEVILGSTLLGWRATRLLADTWTAAISLQVLDTESQFAVS